MDVPNVKIHILSRPERVSEFWAWLTRPGRDFVAWDLETTGLNQYEAGFHSRMIQFGDCSEGWAIPFQQWRGLIQAAFDWCSRARVAMVGYNSGAYDGCCMEVENFQGFTLDYSIQRDVMILARLGGFVDENNGLKLQGSKHLGSWVGVGERVLHEGMHNMGRSWDTVPWGWKPYPIYGVVDTVATALLWVKWQPRYKRWRAQHDLEMATCEITNKMTRLGMRVDVPYMRREADKLAVEERELEERLLAEYKIEPTKDATLIRVLVESAAFPEDSLRTASGGYSVNKAVLERISHPAAALVRQHRKVHRMRHNYLEGLIGFADSNSLIHAQIRPMEAKTSRMSIANPPLHQLPAGDDVVRRGVIGRRDGEVVVTVDFSQIELRLWASMTGDTALIAAIKEADSSGVDFFTSLCRTIYADPVFPKSDHRRTQVKSSTYTKLFGGGIDKAAETAGVSVEAMMPTWRMLGGRFRSLGNQGMDMVKKGPEQAPYAYIMSPWDRRFMVKHRDSIRALPNYGVQGSAAITFKEALIQMVAAGLGDYLVLPIHDEAMASAPEKEATDVLHEMEEIMSGVIKEDLWGITVPAVGGIGANWAEAKS